MTQQPTPADVTNDDKLWAALCYPIFIVMPIVALVMEDKKDRAFIKYHAVQAIILQVIILILMGVVSITLIGMLCVPIFWLVTLWPAYEAYQGKLLELPVITDFARNQGWF